MVKTEPDGFVRELTRQGRQMSGPIVRTVVGTIETALKAGDDPDDADDVLRQLERSTTRSLIRELIIAANPIPSSYSYSSDRAKHKRRRELIMRRQAEYVGWMARDAARTAGADD